ncbi:MAG: SU10 major capsid protein, partial [Elusimicrobiota bacterium]
STLRRDISGFSGNDNTRLLLDANDKRIVNTVSAYISDWGTHKIFYHRECSNSANAKDLVGINTKYWAISWLDRTHAERLPSESIDRMRAQIVSELTLEDRAENSSVYYTGFTG